MMRKILSILAIAVATSTLGACGNMTDTGDYRVAHPLGVEETAYSYYLAPAADGGFEVKDRRGFQEFVLRYLKGGKGKVKAYVPADQQKALSEAVAEAGLPPSHLVFVDGESELPGATLSYEAYVPQLPDCTGISEPQYNFGNRGLESFGCATQRNLGAMIENPKDLVEPRDSRNLRPVTLGE